MSTKNINSEYEHFNKLSEEWWNENGKFNVLHRIRPVRIDYILSQLNTKNLKTLDILDVGCGGGLVSESLSRLGGRVTGVDFVENNIKVAQAHARNKGLHINYMHGDVEKIKFENKFDLIIIFEVLEHLNDWRSFIFKIEKILKKNGRIIISTINRNIISKFTAIYLAENILNWIPKNTHKYHNFIKPNEIEKEMKIYNLFLEDTKGLIFNPIDFTWKLSKNIKVNYFCTYLKN